MNIFKPYNISFLLLSKPFVDRFLYDYKINNISFLKLYGFAIFLLFFISILFSKNKLTGNFIFYCPFLLFTSLSLILGNDIANALQIFTNYILFFIIIEYCYLKIENIKNIFIIIALSSLVPIISILFDYITNKTVIIGEVERIVGGYFHMSIVSCILYTTIPSLYGLLNFKFSKFYKSLIVIYILVILFAIYLTEYRTALIGYLLMNLFLLYFYFNYIFKLIIMPIILSICYIIIINIDRFSELITGFSNINYIFSKSNKFDYMWSGRFGLWRNKIDTIFSYDNLLNLSFGGSSSTGSHSTFLDIIINNGIFSLFLFFIYLSFIFYRGLTTQKNYITILLISFLISSIFVSFTRGYFFDFRNFVYLSVYIAIILKIKDKKITAY